MRIAVRFFLLTLLCFDVSHAQSSKDWALSGQVTNQDEPAKDFWVSLSGPAPFASLLTDGEGRYAFRGHQAGIYTLRVQKKDNSSEPRSRTLRLVPGLQVQNLNINIPVGGIITGRVRNKEGDPVAGTMVLALARVVRDGQLKLDMKSGDRTDAAGEYRIQALPEGNYVVAVMRGTLPIRKYVAGKSKAAGTTGYPPVVFSPEGRMLETASVLAVTPGEERGGVDVRLRRDALRCFQFQAAGALRHADKPSKAYATVNLWVGAEIAEVLANSPIDGQEANEVCGLPDGEYRLHLNSFVPDRREGVGYARSNILLSLQSLNIGTVNLQATQSLTGTMRLENREKLELPIGVRIRLPLGDRSILAGDNRVGTIAANGDFALHNVYADNYQLVVDGLPKGFYVAQASQSGRDVLVNGLQVGSGALDVVLGSDGPALHGSVSDGKDGGKGNRGGCHCVCDRSAHG